jgi:phage N-6-adenine-methyltransferase
MTIDVHFSQKSDCWETPGELFERLNDEFEFTTDVCAERHNKKCDHYFSPEDDGLSKEWVGVCWCNPPYSDSASWIKKAFESSRKGTIVVCLIPARTDTKCWHEYVMRADEVRLLKGRLKFVGGKASAPFPSAIVIFRPTPRMRPIVRSWDWRSEHLGVSTKKETATL